ncbi:quinone oxidoreductase family protein [Mangrovibacillus cuniculi]|uniref:Zinc-binding alcohol dehydrogenase family protein n=1 Tax=Mangrovibacillus cuniculi TaxID=2593652 RepID=A0A7S8HEM1_9BACI|nr:zinc-binding alcohol dehydrogenase family protein [Mangrovibacillus cuniculi]QPC45878.1 zinc-binding alcohol dehydrogenase family protein [Mangrovibacillus cuniculi]
MKAVIQQEFGSADVLTYTDRQIPITGENEILIKSAYTSVNYADIKTRTGKKGKGKFPFSLGLDVAGIVDTAPIGSTFVKGDRVIAFPKNGSYAEYVISDERLIFKLPSNLSLEKAATMPTVGILSYILFYEIGQVKTTDTIVIHSAAGGVGSMLVQLAKLAGVKKVIGTVGNLDKQEYVQNLGADNVYTYDTFAEMVMNETNTSGANVIFDSVAGDVTTNSLKCLAMYGTLVQFGNSSGKAGSFSTSDVHNSCRNVKGFSLGTTRKHAPERLAPVATKVMELFASGVIEIPVAKIFSLDQAAAAHRLMESRNYEGKILIKID